MKFKIRYADQIVGFFIIAALASLVFVIVVLGGNQRWGKDDRTFTTKVDAAGGLSKNMAVQFKGFNIGNVQDFELKGDIVEVTFIIHEEYLDRVKKGSIVELSSLPVLGSTFVFHPGKGSAWDYGGTNFIPVMGSEEANALMAQGLAEEQGGDMIAALLEQTGLGPVLSNVAALLATLDRAFEGDEESELGQLLIGLNKTLDGVPKILEDIDPILANVSSLTSTIADPQINTVQTILGEGDIYDGLVSALVSVTGTLDSLDKSVAFIPSQLPQLTVVFAELQGTLRAAEEVLVALTNNPLLRGGVPVRANVNSSGTSPRDIVF